MKINKRNMVFTAIYNGIAWVPAMAELVPEQISPRKWKAYWTTDPTGTMVGCASDTLWPSKSSAISATQRYLTVVYGSTYAALVAVRPLKRMPSLPGIIPDDCF
jgi:hypothetical protein